MTAANAASRTPPTIGRRSAASNLVAQSGALVVVSLAAVLVAHFGGAAVLGEYTLLRVLPWLVGVVASCGLPVASAYFLGARRDDPSLKSTLSALALAGAVVGVCVWAVLVPLLHTVLLTSVSVPLLAVTGVTVVTQLVTVWAKACCQGSADLRGANLIIFCEEFTFLPAYGIALGLGLRDEAAVVAGLVVGGVLAVSIGLGRLAATGFFAGPRSRPDRGVARSVIAFGARGQLGNLLWLMNLRLDFLILGGIAGPAVLGVYAVASKFAELMRLPATAVNYVLYPRFTRQAPATAAREARRLLTRACTATVLAAPVLALAAVWVIPLVFGQDFSSAVTPAIVLLIGLAVEGAAAVASAYLWGAGRPGANSIGMGAGVVVTVTFDALLIPHFGATGAAAASSIAYLTTAAVLTALTLHRTARVLGTAEGVPLAQKPAQEQAA